MISVGETKTIYLMLDPDYTYSRNCLNTDVFHYSIATLQYIFSPTAPITFSNTHIQFYLPKSFLQLTFLNNLVGTHRPWNLIYSS